ncbi:MAG: hypothetical protein IKC47_00020 [Clostridia bacterium]|nr:hypothetical protein [Clostridia bacterium]
MAFKNYVLPVVVLLVICIVCVGVLAVLNDVLYVSDEVKFSRAMSKIYPGVEFDAQEKVSYKNANYGEVTSVTWAKDKAKGERVAVIEALSTNVGFGSGNVTLYVVVKEVAKDGKTVGEIAAWSIKDNVGQSYIGKIDGANKWYVGADIANEIAMQSNMTAGATMTSTAINMAINVAADYARSVAEMGSNPQAEALSAMVANLTGDYATASYTAVSTANVTHLAPAGTTLSYMFNATVGAQEVYGLVYDVNGAQEFVVFVNAAANSDKQIVYKSAGVTTEMETAVLSTYLSANANVISVVTEGTTSTYTVVGLKQAGFVPKNYTVTVVVTDGAIASFDITASGFVSHGPSEDATLTIVPALIGATSATVDSALDSKTTGATETAKILLSAAKVALAHYDANNGGSN